MARDWLKIAIGAAIIGVALLPTPDDVTIISPVAQIALGLGTIASGLEKKEGA